MELTSTGVAGVDWGELVIQESGRRDRPSCVGHGLNFMTFEEQGRPGSDLCFNRIVLWMPWGQWIQEGQDDRGPASRETVQAVSTDCWIRVATVELELNKRLRQFP